MSKFEIKLNIEYGFFLDSSNVAIDLFNKIPSNVDEVILDYSMIFNVGCFFAREYIKLKNNSSYNITELYMSDNIKEVFSLISSFDEDLSDDDFIQKLIENTCNKKN